jgi:hypothetical protein
VALKKGLLKVLAILLMSAFEAHNQWFQLTSEKKKPGKSIDNNVSRVRVESGHQQKWVTEYIRTNSG